MSILSMMNEKRNYSEIVNEGSLKSNQKALQVKINNNWEFVFSRNAQEKDPIVTKNRSKAIKGDTASLDYFKKKFANHDFRLSISEAITDKDVALVKEMERKKMGNWLNDSFEKYNDLMDAMAKINIRDTDIAKEWKKVDKVFDNIIKIANKKNYFGK